MSLVTIETIESLEPMVTADRLEVCRLEGIDKSFITVKGQYKPGDKCLYLPVDCILPDTLKERLGLKDNRIRRTKIRGQVSEGVIAPLSLAGGKVRRLAKHLGITKYVAPVKSTANTPPKQGKQKSAPTLPEGQPVYDIVTALHSKKALEMLMDEPVEVTEKLEGSNWSMSMTKGGTFQFNSRRHHITDPDSPFVRKWANYFHWLRVDLFKRFPGYDIVVYGELVGPKIQGNLYRFNTNRVYIFDIAVKSIGDWHWLKPMTRQLIVGSAACLHVPVISQRRTLREYLRGKSVPEVSNGLSLVGSATEAPMREGIVIRPMEDLRVYGLPQNRLIIKQRSPEYLEGAKR